MVTLTVIADEDAEVLEELGVVAMQVGRMARCIEEAYFQGCLLDWPRLGVLFPYNHQALRQRLEPPWEMGALLPVAGMSKEKRKKMRRLRPALAVELYLRGEDLTSVRRKLCCSRTAWLPEDQDRPQGPEDPPDRTHPRPGGRTPCSPPWAWSGCLASRPP